MLLSVVVVALSAVSWWAWQPPEQAAASGSDPSAPADGSDSASSGQTRPETPSTAETTAPATAPTTTAPPTTAPPTTAAPAPAAPAVNVGPLVTSGRALPVIHRVQTTDPVVFLTIDDGVTQDPALIEFVRTRNVPMTMFLNQDYLGDGAFFEQLVALGSRAESHTISHANLRGRDAAFQQQQICQPAAVFSQRFGHPSRYFRPPYGEWDDTTLAAAAGCGMKAVVHWNATMDGADFRRSGGGGLQPGDIVLLHFKDTTITSLQILLDFMGAAGLRPALLNDYLDAAPVT